MKVSDEAFEYLKWQAGDISDLQADRQLWENAYRQKLQDQYQNIAPNIPDPCFTVLDIGSGLGGIDALIDQSLGGVNIVLLDGGDCPPGMKKHDQPHNSMAVAKRFLEANGCINVQTMTPEKNDYVLADLVISLAAWCFHFPPSEYLDYVETCCDERSVIILDVRRRTDWMLDLRQRFVEVGTLLEAPKFQRKMFRLAR